MKKMGIYVIINTVNAKVYIGSSRDVEPRKRRHLHDLKMDKHRNAHLQAAIKKYGIEKFAWKFVEPVEDEAKLEEREQAWIEATRAFKKEHGYNLMREAVSRKHSLESRMKMRASHLGVKLSPEHARAMALSHVGLKRTPEQRKRMSEAMKGTGLGKIPWNKGKPITGEALENIRAAQQRRRERERNERGGYIL